MAFKCKHCSAPVMPLRDGADFVRDHCNEINRLRAELETEKREHDVLAEVVRENVAIGLLIEAIKRGDHSKAKGADDG